MIAHRLSLSQPISALSLRALTALLLLLLSACGGGSSTGVGASVPKISSHPASVTVVQYERAELTVKLKAQSILYSYQWYKNGAALAQKTTATLVIERADIQDAGTYHVTVKRMGETVISKPAQVTVTELQVAPTITSQPVNIERALGDVAEFSVTASGLSPLTYQWFRNGALIDGANGSSYELSDLDYDDAGAFRVEVSNSIGSETSENANLSVVRQRATGLWVGTLGDSPVDVVVPPSGEALILRFRGPSGVSGLYKGQIDSRERYWSMAKEQGQVLLSGLESNTYYSLGVNDEMLSRLSPSVYMRGNFRLYQDGDYSAIAQTHALDVDYAPTISLRNTSLNELAGNWRFVNDAYEVVINISLDGAGVIIGDSYTHPACKVTGSITPIDKAPAFFSTELNYTHRSGYVCNVSGRVEKGYVLIRSVEEQEETLAWYLYSEQAGKVDGFFYAPLKR